MALRVDTKNNNYTPLHLLLVCFIILDIPTVFSWDAFGYDNPTSLEIEYLRGSRVKAGRMFTGLERRGQGGKRVGREKPAAKI